VNNSKNINLGTNVDLSKIKGFEITFSDTKSLNTSGTREPVLNLNITMGGQDYPVSLNLDQKKEQTIKIDCKSYGTVTGMNISKTTSPSYDVSYKIKSIKAIYK